MGNNAMDAVLTCSSFFVCETCFASVFAAPDTLTVGIQRFDVVSAAGNNNGQQEKGLGKSRMSSVLINSPLMI